VKQKENIMIQYLVDDFVTYTAFGYSNKV